MRNTIAIIVIGFISGIAGTFSYNQWLQIESIVHFADNRSPDTEDMWTGTVQKTNLSSSVSFDPIMTEDFVLASSKATQSVVYIKNISSRSYGNTFFDLLFSERGRDIETVSSGSGVILTKDGYIVTNNHVVKGAEKIEVVHNRRTYEARLVGTDPSSDLAVLKIEGNNLPPIEVTRSADVQVGQWVLAVGNPFNLTSTVTAGIVSAKGRELNIMESKFPIESFIQTDAAINPGNSGGALVNRDGKLIGINTAILSRTGSYAGYGFAVPSDVVNKIVSDLIEFGEVQKAFIGVNVIDIDSDVVNRFGLKVDSENLTGVVVNLVVEGGAAENAGLEEGDIITQIGSNQIYTRSDFEEVLSYYSPGDKVLVRYNHQLKEEEKELTLTNREGTTEILIREIYSSDYLGADLEVVSKVEKSILDIEEGVKIVKTYDRGLMSSLSLEDGFIITNINYTGIEDPKQLEEILKNYRGRVRIEGVDASGRKGYYNFYLR